MKALHQGLKALFKCIDGNSARSSSNLVDDSRDYHTISSDFSPSMLQLEARRLGIEAESFDNEELLQAVYKAMKARHFAAVNPNEKSD